MTKHADSDEDAANNARDKFKGELKKMYESGHSSDSDDYRSQAKRTKERPVRRQKMRISHVKEPATPSFVMKLFDRSVDLTQFQPDSPLYPICRAWFRNNPKATNSRLDIKKDAKRREERKMNETDLPPPLPMDEDFIPSPPPPPMVSEDFTLETEEPLSCKEEYLSMHVEHWAAVRNRIKRGMQKRERRYDPSLRLIRQIFFQQSN